MPKSEDVLLEELTDMYYDHKPDDPAFLEENEELADQMKNIEKTVDNYDETPERKIKILSHFNGEWFPDSIDDEDQAELNILLKDAQTYLDN